MAERVSAAELRNRLAEIIGRAAYGKERFVVTRHDTALAAIVPVADLEVLAALAGGEPGSAEAVPQLSRERLDFRTVMRIDDSDVVTLADVIPSDQPLRMLIVGKAPTPVSVGAGHYFQGRQGRMFWRRLKEYGLLSVPAGDYEDEALALQGFGITNIVKRPHEAGGEPTEAEYRAGADRLFGLLRDTRPRIILFVYKRSLDRLIRARFGKAIDTVYGFNPALEEAFGARVFAFPMPGTPCTAERARLAMLDLKSALAPAG